VRLFSSSLFLAGLLHAAAAPNTPRWSFTFTSSNLDPTSVVVDASGNTYLAGSTVGSPFSATPGAYQAQNNGGTCYGGGGIGPPLAIPCRNVFVIKLGPSGNTIFATYFGGTANVDVAAIAVDSAGNVYFGGAAGYSLPASALPITPGAAFPASSNQSTAGNVAYLAKLNASGTQLEYSTLMPGAFLASITADSAGELFFTGQWGPSFGAFPATPGAYQTAPANSTAATVIGKLNVSGTALLWGTYLGGALGYSYGEGIGLDASGNVLTGGTTAASDFPATAGQFSTSDGNSVGGYVNIYLAKLSPDGNSLIYATLLGPGEGGLVLGPGGDIYLSCGSTAFPVTGAGFGLAGGRGNYLVHVAADGVSVLSSIYLPFALSALDVDAAGNAYLVGSGSVQTTTGAFQHAPANDGTNNVVIAKITPDAQVAGVTYFGSGGPTAIAAERDGSVVVAGSSGQGGFLAANLFPAITLENAASYAAGTAVPGEIVAIQGYGIGPATGVSSSPVNNLSGVQVYFGNLAAPVIYAQAQQLNVQVPWEIAGQAATQLQILYNGAVAGGVTLPVGQTLPGIFYIENSDGSLNSPSNPARPGDFVAVFGTGGGTLRPPGVTGSPWPLAPLSILTQSVSVKVAGAPAAVPYAGSAPTLNSGFFQINVTLPPNLTAGAQSLIVTVGGVAGAPAVIAIQ
jgi:uncharacterized protein (TIGR03437 family)